MTAKLPALPPGMRLEFDDPNALEDPRVVEQLKDLIARVRANPLLRYYPHPKQLAFHANRRAIKMYVGGERSGKTVGGVLDDIIQAVDREVVPPHLQQFKIWEPPFHCRLVTPDFGQGHQEILRTLQEWVPPEQLHLGKWEGAYLERKQTLNFANGSFIEFMSQEQDVSKFGGTSRHRLHYDEEPKGLKGQKIREANVNRLLQYRGDEIFTFSPVNGLGSLGDDLWDERGEEIAKDVYVSDSMVVVVSDQDDNPHLDEEGKREAEAKIPERMRAARKSGRFVHSAGLVYEDLDRDLHVVPPLDPKFVQGLERVEVIDPGLNTGVLFGGRDSDDRIWVFDELFRTDSDSIPEKVAEKIFAKRLEWETPTQKARLMDPAGQARNHQTNEKTADAYRRAGIKTREAKNDVDLGVYEVMRRLEHVGKDGLPAPLLFISEDCKKLLWELGRYRKEENDDGELEIVKVDDHLCDCLRYLVMFWARKKRRRPTTSRRRDYVPGTALPISEYPRKKTVPPLGRFS